MEYVIGVDGGGTKTEAAAYSISGKWLGSCQGGASNPQAVTYEKAISNLEELFDSLFAQLKLLPSRCKAICLGLAGVDSEGARAPFRKALAEYAKKKGSAFRLMVKNDAEIALMAAIGSNHGIIVISGTGAIVYGLTEDGRRHRIGGWGHILGDTGSGYEIGLHTLQAVMRSHDGIAPKTALTDMILERHGFPTPVSLKEYIYGPAIKKQQIAEYAEICIRAAEAGDALAMELIRDAALQLADMALAMQKKEDLFTVSRIGVTGSIFKNSRLFLDTFEAQIRSHSNAAVMLSTQSPVFGAGRLALQSLSHNESETTEVSHEIDN
jgi:N-acetylglucosamine kinase-like BadF-type ATPase